MGVMLLSAIHAGRALAISVLLDQACAAARQGRPPYSWHACVVSCPPGLPSVTLSRSLYETVLKDLLLEGGQHSVELWDGYSNVWKVVK